MKTIAIESLLVGTKCYYKNETLTVTENRAEFVETDKYLLYGWTEVEIDESVKKIYRYKIKQVKKHQYQRIREIIDVPF